MNVDHIVVARVGKNPTCESRRHLVELREFRKVVPGSAIVIARHCAERQATTRAVVICRGRVDPNPPRNQGLFNFPDRMARTAMRKGNRRDYVKDPHRFRKT